MPPDFSKKAKCRRRSWINAFVKGGKTGLRLFTEQECKAVMGFPKNFRVPVSRTQMYHQFGNSVAVPVVRKISEQIIKYLLGGDK